MRLVLADSNPFNSTIFMFNQVNLSIGFLCLLLIQLVLMKLVEIDLNENCVDERNLSMVLVVLSD